MPRTRYQKAALLALMVFFVFLGLASSFMVNFLLKSGIEQASSYALGVETKIDKLSFDVISGQVQIDGLKIANPSGFNAPNLVTSDRFNLQLNPLSLLTETVSLQEFVLDGFNIYVEQGINRNNILVIKDNLQQREGKGQKESPRQLGKKVKVDRVLLRNVAVHLNLAPLGFSAAQTSFRAPILELQNVTSDNVQGVVIGELMRRLVTEAIARVIPSNLLNLGQFLP